MTRSPLASRMRAIPLIPAPPMPMKWTVTPPRLLCSCACSARAAHVEHEVGESFGGVGVPGAAGRRAHRREPRRVGEQRHELGEHPFAGELGVGHQHATARGDDGCGVERLLAVAVRQRDVDGGQPDGRHLRDGHRPAPAEHGVRGGVGQVHRVDVGQPDVARRPARRRVARLAVGVQHGDAGRRQLGQGGGERRVERAGALRAAEDEQHGAVGGQAELLPGLGPQRRPVELGDRAPQRDAEDLRAGQAAGHGRRDARGEAGADPVGQARARVGLVHDDRHAAPGPEVGGQRDVAAEPDDDVGVDLRRAPPAPGRRPRAPDRAGAGGRRWACAGTGRAGSARGGSPAPG